MSFNQLFFVKTHVKIRLYAIIEDVFLLDHLVEIMEKEITNNFTTEMKID